MTEKWTYQQLNASFDQLFDQFNPTYPKSVWAPGFQPAWEAVLQQAGWTQKEWLEEVEAHWSGVGGIGPLARKLVQPKEIKAIACSQCATEFHTWRDTTLCANCDGRPKCQYCGEAMTRFMLTNSGNTTTAYECARCCGGC